MSETKDEVTQALEPEKLDLGSHDIAEDRREELLRLFPEIRTEGGKLDLERLKLALGEAVDVGKERYGMTWPGKAECFRAIGRDDYPTIADICKERARRVTDRQIQSRLGHLEARRAGALSGARDEGDAGLAQASDGGGG
jgi:adenine-specific DNA-methyltransferase